MNFSQREMKSRSDSFILGFGTGIENHIGITLRGKFNAFGEDPCPSKKRKVTVFQPKPSRLLRQK
jgi:hypothetical protein